MFPKSGPSLEITSDLLKPEFPETEPRTLLFKQKSLDSLDDHQGVGTTAPYRAAL